MFVQFVGKLFFFSYHVSLMDLKQEHVFILFIYPLEGIKTYWMKFIIMSTVSFTINDVIEPSLCALIFNYCNGTVTWYNLCFGRNLSSYKLTNIWRYKFSSISCYLHKMYVKVRWWKRRSNHTLFINSWMYDQRFIIDMKNVIFFCKKTASHNTQWNLIMNFEGFFLINYW